MIIAPIIFCTVVHGIASMRDLKKLGRIGVKTVVYFEIVSTIALVIGLVVVNFLKPGVGFNIDPKTLDPSVGQAYASNAHSLDTVGFFLNIIPRTFFDAFASGDLLQVLFVAALTAAAIAFMGRMDCRCCAGSNTSPRFSSASCTLSSRRRRSARSEPWRSPSAATASVRSTSSWP